MKITDYSKVTDVAASNVLLMDGDNGTKGILAENLAKGLLALMSSTEFVANFDLADISQVTSFEDNDRLLVGTNGAIKAIKGSDAMYEFLDAFISPEQRRMTFRGKSLGTALTSAQKQAIYDGTFKGMFLGDYWEIGGYIWRIVDFNYWWNSGDTACTTNHIVVMPDSALYNAQMNSSNTTTGGYVGSEMYTTNISNAKSLVISAFGSGNILTHREYLVNAVTNGYSSAGAWYDSTVELPNEIMMYGTMVFTDVVHGTNIPTRYTIDKQQLALMQAVPKFINPSRQNQWLRDPVNASYFAIVDNYGYTDYAGASNSLGVRPVFGVKGAAA